MSIIQMLNDTLLISKYDIIKYAMTSPHRYKVYTIAKRNSNKRRTIAHPAKELKYIQRLLIKHLEPILPIHKCALAYRKGVGIKENANIHRKTKYLLKIDFKDFFPSITPEIFFLALERINYTPDDLDCILLKNFLFYKLDRKGSLMLSIGAPSSPLISNFILYQFDCAMSEYCEGAGINYSRYADDITLSTNTKDILFEMPDVINNFLHSVVGNSITINQDKTIFSSKAHNRHVTGITLTNDGNLSIGRKRKRIISSMVHRFSLNSLADEDLAKLRGTLSFVSHIEPDFIMRLESKYGIDVIRSIRMQ